MLRKLLSSLLAALILCGGVVTPALSETAPDALPVEEAAPAAEAPAASAEPAAEPLPAAESPSPAETPAPSETAAEVEAEADAAPTADIAYDTMDDADPAAAETAAPAGEAQPEETLLSEPAEEIAEPEAVTATATVPAVNDIQVSGEFSYETKNGAARITAYLGKSAEVTLPAALGGSPVVVGSGAFANCPFVTRVIAADAGIAFETGALSGCAKGVALAGRSGSAAEKFAAAAGVKFESLDLKAASIALQDATIGVGQSLTLDAVVLPEGAQGALKYATSAKKIATVSAAGIVKGVAKGTATITVAAENGVKGTCKVTVLAAPPAITLNAKAASLGVGESFSLQYTLTKNTMAQVKFASDKPDVASVDGDTGAVRALKAGTATITAATHNGKKATCKITVLSAPESIKLSADALEMGVGLTAKLAGAANTGAAGQIRFRSGDESVVKAAEDGTLTGVAPGTATVTAYTYVDNVTATAQVTVLPVPESVTVVSTVKLGVKDTFQLQPVLEEGVYGALTYTSSKTSVATVSATGLITAKATGKATITVTTANGKSAACKVTVVKAPSAIALNVKSGKLGAGETYTLKYTLTKGTLATVKFTSSNPGVAVVDEKTGMITAVKAGKATITATTHNGKKAACKVTVLPAPESIKLSSDVIEMGVGLTATLTGSVNKGAMGTVHFRSEDESVVKVTDAGKLTAVAVGTATVTAYTHVEGVTATAQVTVLPVPESVSVVSAVKLGVKDTFQLQPALEEGVYGALTYKSSKTSVATVSATGLVKAKAKGTATITVTTANGKKATCKVTVVKAPSAVVLNAKTLKLGVGETFTLKYTLSKGSLSTVKFASLNSGVASIDEKTGVITAVKPGTATVGVITHNGKKAACKVTVLAAPESIQLSKDALEMGVGLTATLTGSVNKGAWGAVHFRSEDESVVKVTDAGKLTGVAPGTATVTAYTYVDGVTATAQITVKPVPASVSVTSSAKLGVKDTFQLVPVIPEGTLGGFTYKSSKTSVATVSATGLITAKKAGTATIQVTTANGKKANCKVTVLKAPSAIALNASAGVLGVGQTATLTYKLPKNTAASVSFESSDPEIVAVDEHTGRITALKTGTVTITATTYNKKTARCAVTVYRAPERIDLSEQSITLGTGMTATLVGAVDPGAYGEVSFTSANTAVAKVNADGKITAVAPGETEIIATTYVDSVTASAKVKVVAAPGKVTVPASLTLGKGDVIQLVPEVPEGTSASFTYKSTKASVASVNGYGLILAQGTGTATITVTTHNGKSATCKVTVKNAPTKVTLNHVTASMGIGETLPLQCTLPSGAAGSIRYYSSDESVVVVDPDTGVVTALSGGVATVTASTYNNLQAVCQITVVHAPTGIVIYGADTLGVGQTLQLTTEFSRGGYSVIDWSSSDPGVISVDESGLIRAVAVGTADITAKTYVEGVEDTVEIAVKPAPGSFTLKSSTIDLASFDTYQIVPVLAGDSAASFTYSSGSIGIATVSETGLVTAYEPGTAVITVTSHNGKMAQLTVKVYDPYHPSGITVGDLPEVLSIGSTLRIPCQLEPKTAGQEMIWTSVDPSIAVVNENGLVTALSPGLATITGISKRNSALKVSFSFIVLSAKRALTLPAQTTAVSGIEANMELIRAIEGSAYAEIYQQYAAGMITEAEYTRRVAIIKNAFAMYAFPWVSPTNEPYWKAANSENGAKDFKKGVVYYGVPYTSSSSARGYNTAKLLTNGYYTKAENGDYYIWNTDKFSDRAYKGTDCSGFAGMAYFGATSSGINVSSSIFAKDTRFKTIPWTQPLRSGDLLVASGHHVAIFLYYVDAARTQIMIIDQGGGGSTVAASIKKVSYYTSRSYIIRRLTSFAN